MFDQAFFERGHVDTIPGELYLMHFSNVLIVKYHFKKRIKGTVFEEGMSIDLRECTSDEVYRKFSTEVRLFSTISPSSTPRTRGCA